MHSEIVVYPVRWTQISKSITTHMAIALTTALVLVMGVRYLKTGCDYAKTFEHISPLGCIVMIVGLSILFGVPLGLVFKLATVKVLNNAIEGINYWGFKNRIPLDDIVDLVPFSTGGVPAVIVVSRYHGKVYIACHTERFEDLLDFLCGFLPAEKTKRRITTASSEPSQSSGRSR